MRLSAIADSDCRQLKETLLATWHPKHPDLSASAFPIYDYETFQALPKEDKTFGLVIYAPALVKQVPPQGIQMNSIYIIAKGMDKILERFKEEGTLPTVPNSSKTFSISKKFYNRMDSSAIQEQVSGSDLNSPRISSSKEGIITTPSSALREKTFLCTGLGAMQFWN